MYARSRRATSWVLIAALAVAGGSPAASAAPPSQADAPLAAALALLPQLVRQAGSASVRDQLESARSAVDRARSLQAQGKRNDARREVEGAEALLRQAADGSGGTSLAAQLDPVLAGLDAFVTGPVTATVETADGLHAATFDTLQGTVTVNLPDDTSAGDTISGTVETEPKGSTPDQQAENGDRLGGYVVEVEKQPTTPSDRVGKWVVPAAATALVLVLKNRTGHEVARTQVPVLPQQGPTLAVSPIQTPTSSSDGKKGGQAPETPAKPGSPAAQSGAGPHSLGQPAGGAYSIPAVAQAGHALPILGRFDGDLRTTTLKIGGRDGEALAESPRKLVVRSPKNAVGPLSFEVGKNGVSVVSCEVHNVGVRLAAPRTNLVKGERTTMTMTVTGLAGLDRPIPVKLVNASPTVVSVEGGDRQVLFADPHQARADGSVVFSRGVAGIRAGGWDISAAVDGSQLPPARCTGTSSESPAAPAAAQAVQAQPGPNQTGSAPVAPQAPTVPAAARPTAPCLGDMAPADLTDNWDLELPLTSGWVAQGDAFSPDQPTYANAVWAGRVTRQQPPSLGGDYWRAAWAAFQHEPVDIGIHGDYWVGTFDERPTPGSPRMRSRGEGAQGTLTSKEFAVAHRYVTFLIGGGQDPNNLRVELELKRSEYEQPGSRFLPVVPGAFGATRDQSAGNAPGAATLPADCSWVVVLSATGRGEELLHRERFDLQPFQSGAAAPLHARIRVVDSSPAGHINVDDFRFTDDPALSDPPVRVPVFGFADLHTHPAANLGFGQNLYVGSPIGRIEDSLASCALHHDTDATDKWVGPTTGLTWVEVVAFLGGPVAVVNMPTLLAAGIGAVVSGSAFDLAKAMLYSLDGPLHSGVGYPALMSYRYTNQLHQHMYVDWIRRAYDGGLRLMVAHPVHTALLANIDPKANRTRLDDRSSGDDQLALIKTMVELNSSWMEIAYNPAQARDIIRRDKLAVVLGLELDAIGNFRNNPPPSSREMNAELDRLWGEGVRHIFPIHLTDSAFGGMAIYNDLFNLNSVFLNGIGVAVQDGRDRGIQYRLALSEGLPPGVPLPNARINFNNGTFWDAAGLQRMLSANAATLRAYPAHRNALGLTDVGREGITHLMNMGMIIDIDHMSDNAIDEVLAMAETRVANGVSGYPVVSGHSDFRELGHAWGDDVGPERVAHEAQKTRAVAQRVIHLGGMFAPITDQMDRLTAPGSPVANDAPGTSKSFAQNFHYAVTVSGAQGVAIGTDMAMLGGMGPRFGTDAAPLDVLPDDMGPIRGHTFARDGSETAVTDAMRDAKLEQRRRDARAQASNGGVRYDSPIRDYRRYRFFWTYGNTARPIYNEQQRDFWEALAISASGTPPDQAEQPGVTQTRSLNTHNVVVAFAEGLSASDPATLVRPVLGVGKGEYFAERRAAFLMRHPDQHGRGPGSEPGGEEANVESIRRNIQDVWTSWTAMSGPNTPLQRLVYSGTVDGQPYTRDFDFNIDGLAHYGMVPDMIQDLQNIGLPETDLASLFNSTEAYLRVWEKAWSLRMAEPPR